MFFMSLTCLDNQSFWKNQPPMRPQSKPICRKWPYIDPLVMRFSANTLVWHGFYNANSTFSWKPSFSFGAVWGMFLKDFVLLWADNYWITIDHYWTTIEPLLTHYWPLLNHYWTTIEPPLTTIDHYWPLLTTIEPLLTTIEPLLTTIEPLLNHYWPLLSHYWSLLTTIDHYWPLLNHYWPLLNHYWTTIEPLLTTIDHYWTTIEPLLNHYWPLLSMSTPLLTTIERGKMNSFPKKGLQERVPKQSGPSNTCFEDDINARRLKRHVSLHFQMRDRYEDWVSQA